MINTRIYFGLVRFPIFSISIFFICFLLAAFLFPGSEIEHLNFKSDMYSLSHDFLSGLGGLETSSGEINTASSILFNGSLVLVGATLVLFYMRFKDIFKAIGDSEKSIKLARLTQPVGLVAGILFAGVGIVDDDNAFIVAMVSANNLGIHRCDLLTRKGFAAFNGFVERQFEFSKHGLAEEGSTHGFQSIAQVG